MIFVIIFYLLGIWNSILLYSFTGFIFLSVAQLSHIQYECIEINKENKNYSLYNQVSSTVNYKTDSPLIRFISFGLDIQIEHHLFPNIPHSSLRKIKPIVKSYCLENNIPYVDRKNIFVPLLSYINFLYFLGK